MKNIKERVKSFVIEHIADAADLSGFSDSTPLISSGLMDSITTLQLVEYLEDSFKIEFKPYEVHEDNLDTIDRISAFVESRLV